MSSTNLTPKTLPRPERKRGAWDFAILAGLIIAVLLGLFGMAAATGWEETIAQVSKLSWAQVGILLALSLANYLLRSLRWHIFATHLGLPTKLIQNARHFLGGLAMAVTPGRLGEFVRMRWLRRETGWTLEKTAPLLLVDRASDLAAMAAILAIALALSTSGISGAFPIAILGLIAALVSTRPRLLALAADIGYRIVGRWPRLFARVRTAARSLSRFSNPGLMTMAVGIGALGWLAEGYAFHLLLVWMGASVSLASAMAIFMFSTIAGGLTGAPGGIGGAEAAMVALLSIEGVPLEVSLPATAIIRLTTLWFAIVIGMIVFPFAERHSIKVRNALEEH